MKRTQQGHPPSTIVEAGRNLRAGLFTAVDLTQAFINAIEILQPDLNAFITITSKDALDTAAALDAELLQGRDRGPLHGIPVAYKDNIGLRGVPFTVGSSYFRDQIAEQTAAVVTKLEAAGAISLGKTNMTELGTGAHSENEFFGAIRNPWNIGRSAGGSSNGPAVAVSAGLCLAGIATDSGGSLRQPAAWCNLVGIRPTFGLVSRAGIWGKSLTLGATGAVTRTVHDNALVLNVMAEHGPSDVRCVNQQHDYTAGIGHGISGIRIGVIEGYSLTGIDREVAQAVQSAIGVLLSLGALPKDINIPVLSNPHQIDPYKSIVLYEASQTFGKVYWAEPRREVLFGQGVHRFFKHARSIAEEEYETAQRQRAHAALEIRKRFQDVDLFITSTVPTIPPSVDAPPSAFANMRKYSHPFGFSGLPSITVPAGISHDNLPIGMQLTADQGKEVLLYQVAAAFEQVTGFYQRRPPIRTAKERSWSYRR